MPDARPVCANCNTRLCIEFVLTVKPTRHVVDPVCRKCEDDEVVAALIKNLLLNAPEKHVRIITIDEA